MAAGDKCRVEAVKRLPIVLFFISGPEVIKLFSYSVNSTEDEIFHANKSEITNNAKSILLLIIAEHENFSANKYENSNYCWHFHIY